MFRKVPEKKSIWSGLSIFGKMPSGPENAFSNCITTCTIIGTTGKSEKSLGNRYSGVFGAAELYSGIRITRGCTGVGLWGCLGVIGGEPAACMKIAPNSLVGGFRGCRTRFWH